MKKLYIAIIFILLMPLVLSAKDIFEIVKTGTVEKIQLVISNGAE